MLNANYELDPMINRTVFAHSCWPHHAWRTSAPALRTLGSSPLALRLLMVLTAHIHCFYSFFIANVLLVTTQLMDRKDLFLSILDNVASQLL